MSLNAPVFPPMDLPAERTQSRSSSSIEPRNKQNGLSYSTGLFQWHKAVSSLPYELSSSSAPPSPGSQERTAKLQADIEEAVREGRTITDFCKLRSTKFGCASKQTTRTHLENGDSMPWILAETEEEWFEWANKRAVQSATRKDQGRDELPSPPNTMSQNAHDKVLSWQAGLLPPSPATARPSPAPSASTGRSSLPFPVVKRCTNPKDTKWKAKSSLLAKPAPRPRLEPQNDGEQVPAARCDDAVINDVHMDTVEAGPPEVVPVLSKPPLEPDLPSIPKEPETGRREMDEFADFPSPSFPSDLVTSTQKKPEPIILSGEPLKSPALGQQASLTKYVEATDTSKLENTARRPDSDKAAPVDETTVNVPPIETLIREIPQATPPSPPYSSETSQQPVEEPETRPIAETIRVPATPPLEYELIRVRPLTPPPETEKNGIVSVASDAQSGSDPVSREIQEVEMRVDSSPRTPDRTGSRTRRQSVETNLLDVSCVVDRFTTVNGYVTPDAAINGVTVARNMGMSMDVYSPRTPKRSHSQLLTDTLTTSRKKRPRPRPPSRKRSKENKDVDMDGAASEVGGDPSPTKSERSYFSSPASGSSSGSDFSRGAMLFVPGSPSSPLGAFTQDPSRFAPLASSTQVPGKTVEPLERGSPLPLRTKSHPPSHPQSPSRPQSQIRKRFESQNQSSSRKQSSMGYNYNSQFDVDARVDQLSNFMRQDVDLDEWVRSTDNEGNANDEDDSVVAVEELTKHLPLTTSSLGSLSRKE